MTFFLFENRILNVFLLLNYKIFTSLSCSLITGISTNNVKNFKSQGVLNQLPDSGEFLKDENLKDFSKYFFHFTEKIK